MSIELVATVSDEQDPQDVVKALDRATRKCRKSLEA